MIFTDLASMQYYCTNLMRTIRDDFWNEDCTERFPNLKLQCMAFGEAADFFGSPLKTSSKTGNTEDDVRRCASEFFTISTFESEDKMRLYAFMLINILSRKCVFECFVPVYDEVKERIRNGPYGKPSEMEYDLKLLDEAYKRAETKFAAASE